MSALIPITGVALDFRVPGAFAEILFAQGPASAAAGERQVVFVMPMLSTGTWTANTLYGPITDSKVAEDGAGAGSPLHRGIRKFLKHNKDAKVWAVPVAETTGGSPVAGTMTITWATAPTGTGTTTVTVCGEDVSYSFKSTDTVTTISTAIRDAINAKSWLPVTASISAGVLTLTAKLKGISQGTASLGVIRVRGSISSGVATTIALSGAFVGTTVAGAEGSTTEATQLSTALATLDAVRKYYIVSSANDATSLGNLKTHIVNKSEPRRGLRSRGITAYTGTGANGATIATGRNYERLHMFWQENSDHDCAEIAAAMAAIIQKAEQVDCTVNLAGYRLSDIISPCYDAADRPTDTEQNDAINDGLAPIGTDELGAYLVMHVNTRSKNSAGTQDDFRATEGHRVSGADQFVDDLLVNYSLNFSQKKFKPDDVLADGKFNPNQEQIANVVRPSTLVPFIKRKMDDYNSLGHLQDVEASKSSLRVLKNGSRAECGFDLHIIDHLLQATFRVAEVSTG
ncbi:MAG TPA: hypothetical protein VL494_13700 [Steroidobacteraceae bacterium]|jgi:phage tail sheath gpL-like|nr:hypothetical protein [Steroidobacteraceae bacterium]